MAELKAEPGHSSLWPSYASPVQMSTGRFGGPLESGLPGAPGSAAHHGRPRTTSHQHPLDHPPYPPYPRYSHEDTDAYERHHAPPPPPPPPHGSLTSHQSFPNLKRTFSQTEQSYPDMVQDIREDGSKMGVNHDHKLLSFKKSTDKMTILDHHGRMQQFELSAQLHGMFFLSEMPASASDGSMLQPELTCYRRNLFQISGSLITPRGQLSAVTEAGETVAINSMEVTISAIESVDGNAVRLIVIPWKTPPPNSPEVSQGPDQEPQSLPLIPFQDDGTEADGDYAVYPIGWRRLQFRIATANNGRRKELQQHFVLHLKVMGTLANGTKAVLTELTTAPIVVRGRSPRNFQARKEIPLLGSSAGSRGQALVETGIGVVAGPLSAKAGDSKPRGVDMQLPRSAFTFSAPKMAGGSMGMRANSYPSWSPAPGHPMTQMPVSGPGNYPPTTMGAPPPPGPEPYHKVPLAGTGNFTAEPQEMPLPTSMPSVQLSLTSNDAPPAIRTQYASYAPTTAPPPQLSSMASSDALSVPRYVDSNPRPAKSPRTSGHQSVHSASSISNTEGSAEYRYSSSNYPEAAAPSGESQASYSNSAADQSAPPRDYYPPSNTWTTTAGEPTSSIAYSNGEGRSYSFPESYKPTGAPKAGGASASENAPPAQGPSPVYGGAGLNHYSWNTN